MERETVIRRQVNGETIEERVDLPPSPTPVNEGKTVAGVALAVITAIGALIIAIGFPLDSSALKVVGIVVVAVGVIAGGVLRAMGLGQPLRARQGDED